MEDVRIVVLGPLRATVDGVEVDLGGPRQRAVLTAMLLARPGPVSVDRILEDVWADGEPPSVGTLQYYVSALRRALGRADVVVRRGAGYELDLGRDEVDVDEFTALAAAGAASLAAARPEAAVATLGRALALWSGPAYADLADAAFLQAERARLEELRLAATEDLTAARLATGAVAEAVAQARDLTARHPLRERGWELLATGLYRAGRQAEALAALRTVRGILADELGLDPGPALNALEEAIRGHDAALAGFAPDNRPPTGRVVVGPAPVPLTPLVGRDALLADLRADLARERLLTLTGPGGVGKTRLAVALAEGDVAWVELGPVTDPELVPAAVAEVLAITGTDVAEILGARRLLLVLDSAEHLGPAVAELVSHVLSRCPGVSALVTTRVPLGLPGETVREVPVLAAEDAAELFVSRARGTGPVDSAAVARICAALDGLPLAVELAAARMRVLSAAELADLLEHDAVGTLDDAPGGRLAGTVGWSYDALPDEESRLFRRLGAFADTFDTVGAAAVRGGAPGAPAAAVAPLAGLIRRSLLVTVPGPGPRRFRMLHTVRDFARARAAPTEREEARAAHRRHVLAVARTASAGLRSPGAATAMADLRRDRAEHRAAWASAVETGDRDTALGLAAALGWFWYRDGAISEGLRAYAHIGGGEPHALARARHGAGCLHYLAGDTEAASGALADAVELATAAGDADGAAHSTAWYAHVRTFIGPPEDGLRIAERATTVDTPWIRAEALMIAGMAARRARSDSARPTLTAAVDVAERAGYGWAVVSSTWALMKAAMDDDDHPAALAAAARMREPLAAEGDVTSWLVLVHTTAGALAGAGHGQEAAVLLGAVETLGARTGFDPARMDPVDGPREAAAVSAALPAADLERGLTAGRRLDRREVEQLLSEVL